MIAAPNEQSRDPQQCESTPPRGLVRSVFLPWPCWVLAAALAAIAVARFVAHDATVHLVWANSFTRYIYLPAYVVVGYAVVSRRRGLAALSGAVVACHLYWVGPDFAPAAPLPTLAADAPRLRIFSANVMFRNPSYEPLFVEIEWHDPDVVVLTEFSPAWSAAVDASPVMDQYPHRITDAREGAFGVALFSKTPLVEGEIWEVRDRPIARATVALGSDEVEIFGVHPPPPVSTTAIAIADDCWDEVLSQFARRTAPVVIVGDFNATQYSLVHQRIIDAGLSSAHELRGRGYATTWPNGLARRGITTPPIRIDHAMISSDLVCLDIQEGIGTGSDHKPLVLEVAILGRAGAAKGSMFVEFAMYFP